MSDKWWVPQSWPEPCAQCGNNTPPFCRCLECGKRLHGIGACFERHKCLVDDEPEETEIT